MTATGGTPPYNYQWSNGQTTSTAIGLFPNNYSVNVQDDNGCLASDLVTISEPSALTLTASSTDATCNGGADGTVTLSISGGTAPYDYTWSNGDTIMNITSVVAGSYTVTVTDSCGSVVMASSTISEPIFPSLTVASIDISCITGSDGSVDLTISGGTIPYTYLWSNSATSEDISGLSANTYSVVVTDACGLTLVNTTAITEPTQLTTTLSATNTTCYAYGDGSATVTATGGTPPYNYQWSNGQTTSTAIGLFPNNYSVNVQDDNGCLASDLVTISEPSALTLTASATDATCNGGADGTVTLSISGGTAPYDYTWSNGDTIMNITSVVAGSYTVTVTDSCGSVVMASSTVSEPNFPSLTVASIDISCISGSDGSVDLTISGGTMPYTYLWSNSATSEDISGLSANTYSVVVTDACGLTLANTTTIIEPTQLTTTISSTNTTCYAYGDGSATVTATGGTPPYNYQWSNSQTTSTAIGLFPNNYSVNVQDDNGCLASALITITQPTALVLTTAIVDATCSTADGSATIIVSGGTNPYAYLWNDLTAQTTAAAVSLPDGTYMVNVTDANGCGDSSIVDIAVSVETPQICLVDVDSLTKKYVVVWEKTGIAVDSFRIYRETSTTGLYEVIGTQAYGIQSDFVDQGSYPEVKSELYKISAIDACGYESILSDYHRPLHLITSPALGNDVVLSWDNYIGFGYVKYRVWRGTAQNNLMLLDSVSSSISNYTDTMPPSLDSLFYRIEVIHPAGCLAQKTKNFNSSKSNTSSMNTVSDLGVSATSTDASAGNCDGEITANVTGGNTPYFYLWNDPYAQTTATATGLCQGQYDVIIVDANGDSVSTSAYVGQGGLTIWATTLSTEASAGICDGVATVTANGGIEPYTYVWDGNTGNQSTQTAIGLCPGIYSVTVYDALGNTTMVFATVSVSVGILELNDDLSAISIFPNPYMPETKISYTLNRTAYVTLEVYNIIGEKVATLAQGEQAPGKHSYYFAAKTLGYPSGIHVVQLKVNEYSFTKRLVELN